MSPAEDNFERILLVTTIELSLVILFYYVLKECRKTIQGCGNGTHSAECWCIQPEGTYMSIEIK